MGTSTPWGTADHSERLAVGIMQYSTPGHGGIHLSKTRQEAMPVAFRTDGGWYEEDCDWALVAVVWPEAFVIANSPSFDTVEKVRAEAVRCVKQWNPDRWTRAMGEPVTAEESSIIADREFAAAHADDYITTSASGSWHENVPTGMVGVSARRGGRLNPQGDEKRFLVTDEEYDARGSQGFVVDLDRHVETNEDFEPLAVTA
jgi:hypothetical protein